MLLRIGCHIIISPNLLQAITISGFKVLLSVCTNGKGRPGREGLVWTAYSQEVSASCVMHLSGSCLLSQVSSCMTFKVFRKKLQVEQTFVLHDPFKTFDPAKYACEARFNMNMFDNLNGLQGVCDK